MPKVKSEEKKALIAAGRWGDFCQRRDQLKEEGLKPAEALRQTRDEFFTSESVVQVSPRSASDVSSIGEGAGKPDSSGKSVPKLSDAELARQIVEGGAGESAAPGLKVVDPIDKLPALPGVRRGQFDGKECSEVQAIRWVAESLEVIDPSPDDCPSAAAWGLLASCRKSPSAKADFWRNTYPKLMPTRAQLEKDEKSGTKDLSKAREVIEDLLEFGRKAREAAGEEIKEQGDGDQGSESVPSDDWGIEPPPPVGELPDGVRGAIAAVEAGE